jgi:hypothetical protein
VVFLRLIEPIRYYTTLDRAAAAFFASGGTGATAALAGIGTHSAI